jgi:hypothetical protein
MQIGCQRLRKIEKTDRQLPTSPITVVMRLGNLAVPAEHRSWRFEQLHHQRADSCTPSSESRGGREGVHGRRTAEHGCC